MYSVSRVKKRFLLNFFYVVSHLKKKTNLLTWRLFWQNFFSHQFSGQKHSREKTWTQTEKHNKGTKLFSLKQKEKENNKNQKTLQSTKTRLLETKWAIVIKDPVQRVRRSEAADVKLQTNRRHVIICEIVYSLNDRRLRDDDDSHTANTPKQ